MESAIEKIAKKAAAKIEKRNPSVSKPQSIIEVELAEHAGEDGATFAIHKDFICFYSKYFRKAFNGPGARNKTVMLLNVKPSEFGNFVHWLYYQELLAEKELKCKALASLWLLGQKLDAPKFQNKVIDAISQRDASGSEMLNGLLVMYEAPRTLQLKKVLMAKFLNDWRRRSGHIHLIRRIWSDLIDEADRHWAESDDGSEVVEINAAKYYVKEDDA